MSTKQKQPSKSFITQITVLALLVVSVCINGAATIYLLNKNKQHDNQQLITQIMNGVEGLNRPLVRDASGKSYTPEGKLALPASNNTLGQLLYSYTPQQNDIAESTKLLGNGKTAHFYTEADCRNTKLLDYVQQITSY